MDISKQGFDFFDILSDKTKELELLGKAIDQKLGDEVS